MCPANMSGAELSSLISKAAMNAIKQKISSMEDKEDSQNPLRIRREHVVKALQYFY